MCVPCIVPQWRKYLRAVGLKDCTSTKNGTAPHSNRRALLAGEGAGNPDDCEYCGVMQWGADTLHLGSGLCSSVRSWCTLLGQ